MRQGTRITFLICSTVLVGLLIVCLYLAGVLGELTGKIFAAIC